MEPSDHPQGAEHQHAVCSLEPKTKNCTTTKNILLSNPKSELRKEREIIKIS